MNDSKPPHGSLDDASLSQLYQEVILDHYRKPRNKGDLDDVTHTVTLNNPLCGDVIDLLLRVQGGRIAGIAFKGKGCSISQASASMMTERLKGKTVDEALSMSGTFTRMLHGEEAASATSGPCRACRSSRCA